MARVSVSADELARPSRWDSPFDAGMTEADVDRLMASPEIAAIEADLFPAHTPLRGILLNDARIVNFQAGYIVVREGDYGNSAFLILSGQLRVVLAPNLPKDLLGRVSTEKKGFFEALTQLWTNTRVPEVRDPERYRNVRAHSRGADDTEAHFFLQDVPRILDKHRTAQLGTGDIFGELSALGRVPRSATVFSETESSVLEIRWQGLRELRRFDPAWKRRIDATYRQNALSAHLQASPLFASLPPESLQAVCDRVKFRTYGSFDWYASYKQMRQSASGNEEEEPIVAAEGSSIDGVYMIRAGFARVSVRFGDGRRTISYLGAGDYFGLDELYAGWKSGVPIRLGVTVSALGYVDVLRVPSHIMEKYVFPDFVPAVKPPEPLEPVSRSIADDAFVEWMADERFINGTQAMVIDLERCVRCDDCVKACASTHGGNPRFIRHGQTFDHWMVANACMHCSDPVCMIGCPTGAIHRDEASGVVVINDDTCIGCGTCANSCPYENIRLVEVANAAGDPLVDKEGRPIVKASKCNLCLDQPGGPACVRACPQDALRRVDGRTMAGAAL